jgi:uncharacterized membrane protein YphA (DoxX/SURF4 family)
MTEPCNQPRIGSIVWPAFSCPQQNLTGVTAVETESVLSGVQPAVTIPEPEAELLSDVTRAQAESRPALTVWPLIQRLGFRLAFVYFVLYALPFPFGEFTGTEAIGAFYDKIWQKVVPWVGHHLLHISYPFSFINTGSGDTTYSWVQNLIYCALALAGCLVWTLLERKRLNYERLHHWLRLYVRLYVGATMISYGAFKVIQAQFPAPNLTRLTQAYGDSSPMGLLWTFMGSSYAYNLFTGSAEVLGGALLIIPPLATLGALVTIAAMGNVFVLNMAYDVPVKLFSFNLIVMAAFIALPDAGRLLNVFVLNRPTEPAGPRPLFKRLRLNDAMRWLQLIFLTIFLSVAFYSSWQQAKALADGRVSDAILGVWSVQDYTVDGQQRPLAMNDAARWQRVILEYSSRMGVQLMDAPSQRYPMELDEGSRSIKLTSRDDPNWHANLHYQVTPPDGMVLKGEVDGHEVEMKLQRKELSSFRLLNRGFHWVSEAPFNR